MKNRNNKIFKLTIIFLAILILLVFYIQSKYIIIYKININQNKKIGILDENLSKKYENIYYSDTLKITKKRKTHGDEMIQFAREINKNICIYYYDASNKDGNIKTENLINGLNWMLENDIKYINISLSCISKNKDLEKWIADHPSCKIYASYNNNLTSFDYPAMYNGVYSSGIDNRINYKKTDIHYKSNKIIFINNVTHIYKGNSYLSMLSMLTAQ